jgi:flagellar secretion chaperone FliS
MAVTAHDIYLETQLRTAPPQRLRLLLISGALRQAALTREHWSAGRDEPGLATLTRCRNILAELLAGIDGEASPLAAEVQRLYLWLTQQALAAEASRSDDTLAAMMRVLEEESETWRLVCESPLHTGESPAAPPRAATAEIPAADSAATGPPPPRFPSLYGAQTPRSSSLQFDA